MKLAYFAWCGKDFINATNKFQWPTLFGRKPKKNESKAQPQVIWSRGDIDPTHTHTHYTPVQYYNEYNSKVLPAMASYRLFLIPKHICISFSVGKKPPIQIVLTPSQHRITQIITKRNTLQLNECFRYRLTPTPCYNVETTNPYASVPLSLARTPSSTISKQHAGTNVPNELVFGYNKILFDKRISIVHVRCMYGSLNIISHTAKLPC